MCIRTCKMHYIEGTEDIFYRRRAPIQPAIIKRMRQARVEAMQRWWRQQEVATSNPHVCVRFPNNGDQHQDQEVQEEQEPSAQQRPVATEPAMPTPPLAPPVQRDAPQAMATPMDLS